MPDQVLLDGLREGEVMRVLERPVTLDTGATVWLRRFTLDTFGRRTYLADGRWLAQLGGPIAHMYAHPTGAVEGGRARWSYRAPHSFATWQDALDAAREAEAADSWGPSAPDGD